MPEHSARVIKETKMGKRKLTSEEQAAVDAAQAVLNQRHHDRTVVQDVAYQEKRLALIETFIPEFKPTGEDGGVWDDDIENLPKWLGDMVTAIEDGSDYQDSIHNDAKEAAEEAAEEAAHQAWLTTYAETYRKLFDERAALPVARRKGLVRYDDNLLGEVIVQPGESTEHVRWIDDDEERRRYVAMAQRGLRVVTDAA
jgi:hypothetical protein